LSPIVGREVELGVVQRFLERVPVGPVALVVEGEAGIGKTTLWLEVLRAAEARSFRVLSARPAESESKLSYAALADLVGEAFVEARAALPEPQERALGVALLRAEADQPADPRTIATALVSVLIALAAERPLVVAVDDAQWLDPASARALEFAIRRLPPRSGLVLTRRAATVGAALPLPLDRALPEDRLERVVLGPLSLAALYHLISDRLGVSLPRRLLARLVNASSGNPFFALEIARTIVATVEDRGTDDPLPVPQGMQELVATRLQALSAPAQEAVLAAAALLRPTVTTVSAAVGTERDPEAALAEAEEADVVVVEGERVRFTHPLLASVVYASAPRSRLRQLHGRLAEIVLDPEERARHLGQSATAPDKSTAAELEQAARHAALRGAQHAAAELFEASARLTPGGRPEELARRILGEASALFAAGDVADARALAERAVQTASSPAVRAEARLLLAEITFVDGTVSVAVDHLERALTEAHDDRDLEVRTFVQLIAFTIGSVPERAVAYADAALQRASEERTPGLVAYILFARFFAEAVLGRRPPRELFDRALELDARAAPSEPKSSLPLIWFHCTDDFEAARSRHAIEDDWYRQRGDEGWRAERLAHLGVAELRAGRWELAQRHVEESCATIEQLEMSGAWIMPFRMRSLVDAHIGRTERARATLLPLIEQNERQQAAFFWSALLYSTLGFVEFAAGDHEAADRALTSMRERLQAFGARELPPDRSEPFHIESLLALDRLDRARDVLRRLEERGQVVPRLWITTTLPRARALVRAAEGDLAAALQALEELDVQLASKLPFAFARTLLVKGRLHHRAKQKRRAADALHQALGVFERLGAPTWADETRRELERVGLRRSPQDLTVSELRVAELAAAGRTNREIAAAAFMSQKTVEATLSRIYRKLGIRSRAQLGLRLVERDRPRVPSA
jgi:DNA-binding CsgD family transcriptional regulator